MNGSQLQEKGHAALILTWAGGFCLAVFFGLFGFLFINMCMDRDKAFWDAERMRGELGPLPPNAKGDLATLCKQYPGEEAYNRPRIADSGPLASSHFTAGQPPPPQIRAGDVHGTHPDGWRLKAKLGTGGWGQIFKARPESLSC
jgi:hypothetical protein